MSAGDSARAEVRWRHEWEFLQTTAELQVAIAVHRMENVVNQEQIMMKTFWSYVAEFWCKLMHPAPMWPVHGFYRCPDCWREYPVGWEEHIAHPDDNRSRRDRIVRPVPTW